MKKRDNKLPRPSEITPELIEVMDRDAREWSEAFRRLSEPMERMTPTDAMVVCR